MSDSEAKDQRVQNSPDAVGQNAPEAADRDLSELVLVPAGDNTPRWSPGERLHHLFEQRCDAFQEQGMTAHLAIDSEEGSLTYDELDRRANQLARHLVRQGLGAGDIIGLLFDRSIHSYISLIAVQKMNAAYVPFDVGFPEDRIRYIADDASVSMILTLSPHAEKLEGLTTPLLCLDSVAQDIAAESDARLSVEETGEPMSELSYIIYTSGTTGRPKGVPIEQGSICNFVQVAGEIYGYQPDDRVYQGLTIAFDFSVEEIWVPLIVGATLVPNQTGRSLVGSDLQAFLAENNVTAMCCVPTLLATIEEDLPKLRLLITSGEACPHDLVKRWYRDGRTILNAYGPTETTVTATITEMYPDKPVTIGQPLPTYSVVVLSPDEDVALPKGETGELGVAGICLATGYLGREDLTQQVFIPDFLGIPNNPSNRIYRTGDLARVNEDDEIEYLGRIDTQVKIRGFRIELTEIESIIMQLPGISQAVVDTYEPEPGAKELVAYYSAPKGSEPPAPETVAEELQALLPAYMVPAFYEPLDIIPMTTNDKADRKALPPPSGQRLSRAGDYVAPETELEAGLTAALADLLKIEQVSVEDHFFDNLGTNSLLMAHFSTKIRKELGITDFSMRDIYMNPTVRSLAALLSEKSDAEQPAGNQEHYRIPSTLEYYGCGALQLLFFGAHIAVGLWLFVFSVNWVFAATSYWDVFSRTAVLGGAAFVISLVLPPAVKWGLIGRWKEERFPIWSLSYFRFWVVQQYVQMSPMAAFAGTPIYNIYLRMLGARIGKNVIILSKKGPVCTDLISIGDNTILGRGTAVKGYHAEGGYIQTGPVSIGKNVYVGEVSVIDINTVMEDDSQLGHASSLQSGQVIPSGKHYHGTPAEETDTEFCNVEPKNCSTLRRIVYCVYLTIGSFIILPSLMLFAIIYFLPFLFGEGDVIARFSGLVSDYWTPIMLLLPVLSLVLFILAIPAGLFFVCLMPRIANLFIKPDKTYVMFGIHYIIFQYIRGISNVQFFNYLFGDSSAITGYLQCIGYDLSTVIQTGSNFGVNHQHDNPLLCHIGTGSMVSDGLIMKNAEISTTSFKVSKAVIGDHSYLGNMILYPSNGKTGDNCLFATKVMIPIDGPVREDVGLLGSPCFEIPRVTLRDQQELSEVDTGDREAGLRGKNAHNTRTVVLWLFLSWVFSFIAAFMGFASLMLYNEIGIASFVIAMIAGLILTIGYFVGVEWLGLNFKRLQPVMCTVYDPRFWAIERHWKLAVHALPNLFAGTPFKNVISRMMGVKIGKRVYDGGCGITEKTLTEIGDYCTLDSGTTLQAHSLEEGVFKADRIKLGKGCSLGVNAFVHYGVTMGDNAILTSDSFLMKGETVEPDQIWQGNPARAI